MLLIVPKQNWCNFEALECIFHLNLKKIPSVNQLTHNHAFYSVSEHMVDPVGESKATLLFLYGQVAEKCGTFLINDSCMPNKCILLDIIISCLVFVHYPILDKYNSDFLCHFAGNDTCGE